MCNEIEGSYDKHYSTKLFQKKYVAVVLVLHTHNNNNRNNTDNNKLMIFSSIALYYGDTYIPHTHAGHTGVL